MHGSALVTVRLERSFKSIHFARSVEIPSHLESTSRGFVASFPSLPWAGPAAVHPCHAIHDHPEHSGQLHAQLNACKGIRQHICGLSGLVAGGGRDAADAQQDLHPHAGSAQATEALCSTGQSALAADGRFSRYSAVLRMGRRRRGAQDRRQYPPVGGQPSMPASIAATTLEQHRALQSPDRCSSWHRQQTQQLAKANWGRCFSSRCC